MDHDHWKSAVRLTSEDDRITGIVCEAGAADSLTRDVKEHGALYGRRVSSPRFLIGCFADWREGLECYGEANAAIAPPRHWEHAMPVGWNSWGALQFRLNYETPPKWPTTSGTACKATRSTRPTIRSTSDSIRGGTP